MGLVACVLKLKFIILFLLLLMPNISFADSINKRSLLHEVYLSKGELDAALILQGFFTQMTPEQINDGIKDIQKFIKEFVEENINNIDQFLFKRIIIILISTSFFIKNALVHKKTNTVINSYNKPKEIHSSEFISLIEYWKIAEEKSGEKIHYHKFLASSLDYFSIALRAYFSQPCIDQYNFYSVHNIIYYMEYAGKEIDDNPIFGGYYNENIRFFGEIFKSWEEDFKKREAEKRNSQNNNGMSDENGC